jgi:hypothetical protein
MIQTNSYVYDCGRWVVVRDLPRSRFDFTRPYNGYFQASCVHIWRGEDLASRAIEHLGRSMVHDEWL